MNYSFLDFLTLLGSLGLFLYGMKIMSEGLQKVAGDKLRNVLSAMTTNRFTGILTGFLITAFIQSSTATTVMVVSFVNAGMLSLSQSISVIMGANIGTTFTAWIISFFGFKFNIVAIVLPLIGLALPLIFSGKSKRRYLGEFIVGFALLFMGLEFIKANVPDLQSNPGILSFLQQYTDLGYGSVIIFFFLGAILTVIVQSSSATIAITLVMCSQGWISFEIACAMVLGENLGTTLTTNLAAIQANVSAKRAALSHFIFNIFGVVWLLAVFYPFTRLVISILSHLGLGDPHALMTFLHDLKINDPESFNAITSSNVTSLTEAQTALKSQMISMQTSVSYGLSMFHSLYNIINVSLMIGFVNVYAKIVTKLIKNKKPDEEFQLKYISSKIIPTPELGIFEAKNELSVFAERVHRMLGMVRELNYEKNEGNFTKQLERIKKYEDISDRVEIEIANYLGQMSEGRLSTDSKEEVREIMRANTEIESVSDALYNMSKTIRRRNEAESNFPDQLYKNMDEMLDLCNKAIVRMIEVLRIKTHKADDAAETYNIEKEINKLRTQLKMKNIEDVNAKDYSYQDGIFYMDFISECERLGDYVVNVVEAISVKKEKKQL